VEHRTLATVRAGNPHLRELVLTRQQLPERRNVAGVNGLDY
jgi:hypothetical protein